VAEIHNRMPAIFEASSYNLWLSTEPDPHDLLITYPSEPMMMWPISMRVNNPKNDDHIAGSHRRSIQCVGSARCEQTLGVEITNNRIASAHATPRMVLSL
jgi:hypothetical protein